jgi:Spy/CpxP family protein refolding chaperone
MKQIFAIVGLTMVMAGTAMAQGGGGGGMQMDPAAMATRMIDGLFKDITITDAVKAKATEIITKTMTDNRAIDRSAPDAMEKRQANTKARNDALKALLTSAPTRRSSTRTSRRCRRAAAAVRRSSKQRSLK